MKSKSFFFAASISFFIFSCKPNANLSNAETQNLPSDFVEFYKKFHADSVFQLAHIKFPLEGMPAQADSSMTGLFHHDKSIWVFQDLKGFNEAEFTRRFENPIPDLVNETIVDKKMGFGTYRRFYKRDGEWQLIYYADVNKLGAK